MQIYQSFTKKTDVVYEKYSNTNLFINAQNIIVTQQSSAKEVLLNTILRIVSVLVKIPCLF